MSRFLLSIFADYFQFYVEDDAAPIAAVDFVDAWTEEAVARKLAATPRAIGVGTSRNMTVPVVIEIAATCPDDDSAAELVTEASFEVTSGRLVVLGCTDYAPGATRIAVVPGRHRVRVFYYDLEKLSEDGLEGDDHYRVVLWPAREVIAPQIVVDRRQPPARKPAR